jgi:hypothetical protein
MAKHKLILRLYEDIVELLGQCGVDFGDAGHYRIKIREMN